MAMEKCPKCGSYEIDIGTMVGDKIVFYLSKKSKKILKPKFSKFNSYLCLRCGYMESYAENITEFKQKLQEQ